MLRYLKYSDTEEKLRAESQTLLLVPLAGSSQIFLCFPPN
jgi:hypothetical protein